MPTRVWGSPDTPCFQPRGCTTLTDTESFSVQVGQLPARGRSGAWNEAVPGSADPTSLLTQDPQVGALL